MPAAVAKVRKLPVTFATKAALPKTAGTPGPLSVTLPIGPLPPVAAVAFSPDGKLLATGTYGRVTVWDLATAKPAAVITQILGSVNDLKFSPDGKMLAVAGGQPSARGDLRLFETKDWKLIASLGGHLDTVSSVAWHPDGTKLASASFDKTVRLWDVKAEKVLHTFTGHSDFVYAAAFSPKGDWYATVSKDRSGRVIETATGKQLVTLSGANDEVLAVAVRPDKAEVVTSGFESALQWWDPKTAEKTRRGAGRAWRRTRSRSIRRGRWWQPRAATAPCDFTSRDATSTLRTLSAGSPVFAIAIDASAKRIASGGADGVTKIWDAADGRLLATLWSGPGSGESGDWLAVVPEGFFAASDGVLPKAAWTASAKKVANAKMIAPLQRPQRSPRRSLVRRLPSQCGSRIANRPTFHGRSWRS